MLTLFPRIRPNPIAPPLPLESHPTEAAEPATEAVSIGIEESAEAATPLEAAAGAVQATEAPPFGGLPTVDAATSVSDSDVFSAFLSGLATSNPEPFIVEITAQPSAAELKEESEPSEAGFHGPTEPGAEIVKPRPAAPFVEKAETFATPLPETAVAATQDLKVASEAPNFTEENTGSASPELIVAGSNIFDELDVLHEAAVASSVRDVATMSSHSVSSESSTTESQNKAGMEAAVEEAGQTSLEGEPRAALSDLIEESKLPAAVQGSVNETPAAIPDEPSKAEDLAQESAPASAPAAESAPKQLVGEADSSETVEPRAAIQEPSANATQTKADEHAPVEQVNVEPQTSSRGAATAVTPLSSEAGDEIRSKSPVPSPSLRSPKPRRAKGTLFGLARVPEPETMDDSGEVEAYASAAAQSHLDAIDDTFVAHAQLLLKGRERGRVLDIGTGPGQILIKLGYRLTRWKFVGIDRSATMIERAMESLATAGELAGRVEFRVADGNALDFPDKSFDMVVCNSVLHHIFEPQRLLAEIARVVKPGGAILLRDLRRPSRPGYALHVWKHGKHYSGAMRRLFKASVQAAYTEEELQKMVAASPLRDVGVFRHGKTHIGFERPIAIAASSKK